MITLYELKPAFQNLLRPLSNALAKRGITPNQITLTALFLSIITGMILSVVPHISELWLLLPFILLIRMGLNALDGMIAREHHLQSKLGALLNELGDVISDTMLYLPLVFLTGVRVEIVILIIALSIISEMTGVLGQLLSGTRHYQGPMGKSDRALLVGCLGGLVGSHFFNAMFFNLLLLIAILLLILTIFNRSKAALQT
jgi:CDP-diacylglycerol---glycerol-3-phosphate 3-phosphatidyltransferase